MKIFRTFFLFSAFLYFTAQVEAQISGGNFTVTQSVLAAGGRQSIGKQSALDGTIGQPLAGDSAGGAFAVTGGFWVRQTSSNAAAVSIGGRILTPTGRGIRNVRVSMTGADGVTRTAISSTFGYFRFDDVTAGQNYLFTVTAKRFNFTPQTVFVTQKLTELDFTANP